MGRILRISSTQLANVRPDEPAPWCMTKRGPESVGGVMYTWWVISRSLWLGSSWERKSSWAKNWVQGSEVAVEGDLGLLVL